MSTTTRLILIGVYVLLMAGITCGMLVYRQRTLAALDTVQAHTDWQKWREASASQSAHGPVLRRPIESALPPAEVLLRDYFTPLLAGAIFFTTLFYVLLIWIVRGAASTHVTLPAEDEADPIAKQTGQA